MPRILLQQGTNLVNKFDLLLHKCRFAQDSRDKPENDGSWRCWLSICCELFNHPSPADKSATSPARGEVLKHLFRVIRALRPANLDPRVKPVDDYGMKSVTSSNDSRVVQCGRSMIEMLGVLAIIGVLSVGGIAGYSKAMEMWKISRQKQQLAELFLQCINLKDDFVREYNRTNQRVKTATIMEAMNVIPEGMSKYNDYRIKDFADNEIKIYMVTSRWTNEDGSKSSSFEYLLMFDIYQAETSNYLKLQYCVTFLEQAQAFSPYIYRVENRQGDDSYSGYNAKGIDIKTAKPNDIHNFCKKCNSNKQCTLVLYFKI